MSLNRTDPNYTVTTANVTLTSTTDTELVAAPGAGLSIYVLGVIASNGSETMMLCNIREGTTTKWNAHLSVNGGGFIANLTLPWKLAANTALKVQLETAPTVSNVVVSAFYYVAP